MKKLSFVGIVSSLRSPVTLATAGLSVLWGCHHLPGSRTCRTSDEVVYYQSTGHAGQHSNTTTYEELLSPSVQLKEAIPEPPPVPVEEPAPMPKETSPKLPPLPEPTDMTVPSKKPATPAPKKEETKEPAVEKPAESKPAEPKPADTEKPIPPKKKPTKPKAKKAKKPATETTNSAGEDEEDVATDLFSPDEEVGSESEDSLQLPDAPLGKVESRPLTRTLLEVPSAPESHDSAPSPRELPSETTESRPINDRQPMLEAAQPSDPKSTTITPAVVVPKLSAAPENSTPSTANSEQMPDAVLTMDAYCDHLVFDKQGYGYVTHRKQIVRFSPTGETMTWASLTNPQGHQIEPDGTHLVCDLDRRAVLRLSFDGKIIGTPAKECDGTPLRAPYDLTLDGEGGFYFTDPGFLQMQSPVGKVHYVDRTGQVSLVVAGLGYPTGISYDSTRKRLLVVESLTARITELQLVEPGRVSGTRTFAQLPKSKNIECHVASLCQTKDGTLFVTQPQSRTVQIFNAVSRPIGHLATGELAPNRVALRNVEATEIFISGETSSGSRRGKVIRIALGE